MAVDPCIPQCRGRRQAHSTQSLVTQYIATLSFDGVNSCSTRLADLVHDTQPIFMPCCCVFNPLVFCVLFCPTCFRRWSASLDVCVSFFFRVLRCVVFFLFPFCVCSCGSILFCFSFRSLICFTSCALRNARDTCPQQRTRTVSTGSGSSTGPCRPLSLRSTPSPSVTLGCSR